MTPHCLLSIKMNAIQIIFTRLSKGVTVQPLLFAHHVVFRQFLYYAVDHSAFRGRPPIQLVFLGALIRCGIRYLTPLCLLLINMSAIYIISTRLSNGFTVQPKLFAHHVVFRQFLFYAVDHSAIRVRPLIQLIFAGAIGGRPSCVVDSLNMSTCITQIPSTW